MLVRQKQGSKKNLYLVHSNTSPTVKVAIIDDDEAITRYLTEFFEQKGCNVTIFHSAALALQYFTNKNLLRLNRSPVPFDLILCDLKMPELDGLSLVEKIKKFYPNIPIILVTAYGSIEKAVSAVRLGVADFLEKPISIEKLEKILTQIQTTV